jgi:hypothetical protein
MVWMRTSRPRSNGFDTRSRALCCKFLLDLRKDRGEKEGEKLTSISAALRLRKRGKRIRLLLAVARKDNQVCRLSGRRLALKKVKT